MTRRTTYAVAVNWLHNDFVMCNRLPDVDPSVWDNFRFEQEVSTDDLEIYQWYITSASESDVEFLERSFGLLFTYSDMLDCYVLCVDHCGTGWHYVGCDCYNDDIADEYLIDKEAE